MNESKPINTEELNRELVRHVITQNDKLYRKVLWLERELGLLKQFVKATHYYHPREGNLDVQ